MESLCRNWVAARVLRRLALDVTGFRMLLYSATADKQCDCERNLTDFLLVQANRNNPTIRGLLVVAVDQLTRRGTNEVSARLVRRSNQA